MGALMVPTSDNDLFASREIKNEIVFTNLYKLKPSPTQRQATESIGTLL